MITEAIDHGHGSKSHSQASRAPLCVVKIAQGSLVANVEADYASCGGGGSLAKISHKCEPRRYVQRPASES